RPETLRAAGSTVALGDARIDGLAIDADWRPGLERYLGDLAARELPPRLLQFARLHDLNIARVSVRNQRSRWGACSPSRVITLHWRLVQMPPVVTDYVILHELMHLRQSNHSRRFWREVE